MLEGEGRSRENLVLGYVRFLQGKNGLLRGAELVDGGHEPVHILGEEGVVVVRGGQSGGTWRRRSGVEGGG